MNLEIGCYVLKQDIHDDELYNELRGNFLELSNEIHGNINDSGITLYKEMLV